MQQARLSVSISQEALAALKQLAQQDDRKLSAMARKLLEERLLAGRVPAAHLPAAGPLPTSTTDHSAQPAFPAVP